MRTMQRVHALSLGISIALATACSDVSAPPTPADSRIVAPAKLIADGSGSWTTGPSLPQPVVWPATGVVNGRYYVATPSIHGTGPLQLQVFDPATGIWSIKPSTVGRGRAMAAGVGGKFYVVGGAFESDPRIFTTDLLQSFDPATDAWTTLPPMPTARSFGSAAELNGKLYVVGGMGACAPCGLRENLKPALEVFDPATNSWSSKAPMPMARSFVSAVGVNGKLYVVSVDDTPSGFVGALDVYDPATNSWSEATPAPTSRGWSGATLVDGFIYSVGGYTSPFPSGASQAVEAYDPATDTWASVASIPSTGVYPRPQGISGKLYTTITVASSDPTTTLRIFTPAPDVTPPVVSHVITGAVNGAGWYNTNVSVAFTAADGESPVTTSGCEARSVTLDTPVDGITFTCVATSAGGQTTDAVTIKLDKTAPVVSFTGNAGTYTVDQTVSIGCTASDALSGVATSSCTSLSQAAHAFDVGVNSLSATAADNAGNSGEATTSFAVTVTPAGLSALVERLVTSAGVATSLSAKLARGQYHAFRNELAAQTGKKVSAVDAALLRRLSLDLERP